MSEAAVKTPKAPRHGVGAVIRAAILAGKDNGEALEAARKEFPDSKTTAATVSWYRNQLRKGGNEIPTSRALKPKVEKPAKADKKAKKAATEEALAATDVAAAEADPLA